MTVVRAARSRPDELAEGAIAGGLGLLVVIGFVASWETLRDLAASAGGFSPWLAPVVPLSFDLGIVVLSLKVVLAAREGRSATILRGLVVALSAATVAANAAAADSLTGQLLHAVPPAMFVICFESVVVTARRRALERLGLQPPRLPRVRPLLWLLAPADTWREWRAAVLAGHSQTVNDVTRTELKPPPVAYRADEPVADAAAPPVTPPTTETSDSEVRAARDTETLGSADGHPDRIAVAVATLRRSPGISAAALADTLRERGHEVSVRTAQRVKADALSRLSVAGGDGAAA